MKNINNKIKNDIILIVVLLLVAAVFFIAYRLLYADEGAYAIIEIDGDFHKQFSLDADITYTIPGASGINCLEIKDGKARIVEADCRVKICVIHRAIENSGESIICLPHKVVVRITGAGESETDAIAN